MGRATLIGFSAVAMWALLALLTDASGQVPPFLLSAITFAIGTCVGLAARLVMPAPARSQKVPSQVWVIGIAGLFGYHFFYFLALRNAPPADAGLIAYMWPLLIVVFSALLPGERLRWYHLAGALLGLAGTVLLITGGNRLTIEAQFTLGYLAAIVCALTWSGYSVLSRFFGSIPTDSVGGFCAATAVLAALCHVIFETTIWPQGGEWLAVLALGLGPVGLAFFTWDHGVKRGDIKALGAFSYAAPLLSTLILIAFGKAQATGLLIVACLLITGGAVLAAMGLLGWVAEKPGRRG